MSLTNSFGTRTERAAQIVAKGGIRVEADSIIVPSSDGRREYTVRLVNGQPACNCEDYRRRQMACKHVLSAQSFAAQESERS